MDNHQDYLCSPNSLRLKIRPMEPQDEHAVLWLTKGGIYAQTTFLIYQELLLKPFSIAFMSFMGLGLILFSTVSVMCSVFASLTVYPAILGLIIFAIYARETAREKDFYGGMFRFWDCSRLSGVGQLIVAELDGTIIGTAAAIEIEDRVFEIKRLKVAKKFCRQGIANLLMRQIMDYCEKQGASRMILSSLFFQRDAIRLYSRMGFAITGIDTVTFAFVTIPIYHFTHRVN